MILTVFVKHHTHSYRGARGGVSGGTRTTVKKNKEMSFKCFLKVCSEFPSRLFQMKGAGVNYGYGTLEKLTLTAADRRINVSFMNISQSQKIKKDTV